MPNQREPDRQWTFDQWLKDKNLASNPFSKTFAENEIYSGKEEEKDLKSYFVASAYWGYAYNVDPSQIVSNIFFGEPGSGKTAIAQMLKYTLTLRNHSYPALLIEFGPEAWNNLEQLKYAAPDLPEMYERTLVGIAHKALIDQVGVYGHLRGQVQLAKLNFTTPDSLAKFTQLLRNSGIEAVYFVLDKPDDKSEADIAALLSPLMRNKALIQTRGVGFQIFLPPNLKDKFGRNLAEVALNHSMLWDYTDLIDLVDKRLEIFSSGTHLYFFQLFEQKLTDGGKIYDRLFRDAKKNPRTWLDLCRHIIDQHRAVGSPALITEKTYNKAVRAFKQAKKEPPKPNVNPGPATEPTKGVTTTVNEQRIADLKELIARANKLRIELEEDLFNEARAMERARIERDLKRVKEQIQRLNDELKTYGVNVAVSDAPKMPSHPLPPITSSVPPAPTSYTVLFLGYSPKEATQELNPDAARTGITSVFSIKRPGPDFDFYDPSDVTEKRIKDYLRMRKPHIVQFFCHASSDGELLIRGSGSDDARAYLAASDLAEIIRSYQAGFGRTIKGIILSACYSEEIARLLEEQVDFVIGSTTKISSKVNVDFSQKFYYEIYHGGSLQYAFNEGKRADEQNILRMSCHNPGEIYFK